MKTKLIIDISNKKDPENMEVKYVRRDLETPATKDEEMILKYIETLIRFTIDNGFMSPTTKKDDDNGEARVEQ